MKSDKVAFHLTLLGPFLLRDGDGGRVPLSSRKSMALLAMLATAPDGERTRAWLRDKLWGSRAAPQAQSSLRRELATLRSVLASAAKGADVLGASLERVRIDLTIVDTDVREPPGCRAGPAGEFLEGFDLPGEEGFEDWLREQRGFFSAGHRLPSWIKDKQQALDVSPDVPPVMSRRHPLRPSVMVAPFASTASSPELDDLLHSFGDEVSVALTKFGTLNVVGAGAGASEVHHIVEGRISVAGRQVRIWVKLIDAASGVQVWTERFDDDGGDYFLVQDRFAVSIARQIDSAIEKEEMRRALAAPPSLNDCYTLFWRANALFRRWSRELVAEAVGLCEQAQRLDPAQPWPFALACFCRSVAIASGWCRDTLAERLRAGEESELALQLGADDAMVLGYVAGTLLAIGGDIDHARRLVERAGQLGPGYQSLPFWRGLVECCSGDTARAVDTLSASLEINPRSAVRPLQQAAMGLCLFLLGRSGEAIPVLEDACHRLPDHPVALAALAAALVSAGRGADASILMQRLGAVDPQWLVVSLLRDPEQRGRWIEHLRLARDAAYAPSLRLIASSHPGGL